MDRRKHYRPAPADAAALRAYNQRVSLSQGRLSSAPLLPEHLTTSPRNETSRREVQESLRDYELPQRVVDTIAREERDKARSLMLAEQKDVLKHPTVGPDLTASPRLDRPQQYEPSTHSMMQSTSDLLALSDIEDIEQQGRGKQWGGNDKAAVSVQAIDISTKVTRHIIGTPSQSQQQAVMLVDATSPKEPIQSEELPVTTSIYASPIRVIRHLPKRIETNKRTITQQGAVKDDVLVTLSDFEEPESELDKQEDRQRVSQSARSLEMSQKDGFGGEDDDLGVMPLEPAVNEELYRKMESSVRQEIAQKHRRETGDVDDGAGGREESKPTEKKKKKRKGRIVPSRYMAKVQTTDQSILEHKTAVAARVKPQRSSKLDITRQSKATEPPSHSHSRVSHQRSAATPPLPIQPVNRSVWQSTPFGSNDSHVAVRRQAAAGPDVSCIAGDTSHNVTMRDGHHSTVGFASFYDQTRMSQHTASHAGAAYKTKDERSVRGKSASSSQFTEKDLYLLGCRMRQWSFLATMADKALHEQEKDAMNQLYAIWSETEKLRLRHHNLTAALKEANCNEELDRMLDVQLKGLGPILNIMERLEPQYSRLALALDTTRHQLPTWGIKLPENPDKLVSAMGRTEEVLGDILAAARQQQPKAASLSQTMQALSSALQAEEEELHRCNELLSACESLGTKETSMMIHEMQTGNLEGSVRN